MAGVEEKLLRPACRLAVDVARAGLVAKPAVPPPAPLNMVVGFKRLSQSAYSTIRRAVDADEAFRERVAQAADEAEIGRAGWLWLNRPDGWEAEIADLDPSDDPAVGESPARMRKRLDAAEATAKRNAAAVEAAVAARKRAEQKLADARERARPALAERDQLQAEVKRLSEERASAVRKLKATEADLAAARRELKVARQASVEAQAELLELQRSAADAPEPASPSRAQPAPTGVPGSPPPVEAFDAPAVRRAVDQAADAAAQLSRALAAAAHALASDEGSVAGWAPAAVDAAVPASPGGRRKKRRAVNRRPPELPPGVFDDSAEARRHLITAAGATLVVDGYNVARTAWPTIVPEEERRRTVSLLEDVHARSGDPVVVVFDGDSDAVAPAASRSVRVRFSPSGVTADEAISDLLASLPPDRPVVVVSSDKEVARDARRQGASVLSSADFLAAAGR